jgi:hypothetical protein
MQRSVDSAQLLLCFDASRRRRRRRRCRRCRAVRRHRFLVQPFLVAVIIQWQRGVIIIFVVTTVISAILVVAAVAAIHAVNKSSKTMMKIIPF